MRIRFIQDFNPTVGSKGNSDFKEAWKHLGSPVEPSWIALEDPMQQTQA